MCVYRACQVGAFPFGFVGILLFCYPGLRWYYPWFSSCGAVQFLRRKSSHILSRGNTCCLRLGSRVRKKLGFTAQDALLLQFCSRPYLTPAGSCASCTQIWGLPSDLPGIRVPSSCLGKEKLLGFKGRGCLQLWSLPWSHHIYHGLNLSRFCEAISCFSPVTPLPRSPSFALLHYYSSIWFLCFKGTEKVLIST